MKTRTRKDVGVKRMNTATSTKNEERYRSQRGGEGSKMERIGLREAPKRPKELRRPIKKKPTRLTGWTAREQNHRERVETGLLQMR